MPILEAKMLQNCMLEPHFLSKPLLDLKWDHHPLHQNHFLRFCVLQGGGQNSQKTVKNRFQNITFFWNVSWKASWTVLGAKLEPKPSKITPKIDSKEITRAYKKVKDFERKTRSKNARKSILETNVLKT